MRLRRLHPGAVDVVGVEEAVAGLAGRTTLVVNMVATADGRAAVDGRTAPIGSPADREVFHVLRAQADAVLVGPGTLRAERYGPFTKDDRRRAMRAAAGLAPEPLGIVLSRSLDLPWDAPLFAAPEARVVVVTTSDREPPPTAAEVRILRTDDLDPRVVLPRVRAEHGVRCVLGEGGPTVNRELVAAGVVDELFLTLAPLLAGGEDPLPILVGALPAPVRLELRSVLEDDGVLLLRYRLHPAG